MNIKKQTLKEKQKRGLDIRAKGFLIIPNERKQSRGTSLKIINSAFPF